LIEIMRARLLPGLVIAELMALCPVSVFNTATAAPGQRWTPAEANAWHATQKWPVGNEYIRANAINQLEIWQAQPSLSGTST
jgi:hypothetical protein